MNKSAIRKAYKEAKRPMGVYTIKSVNADTIFIGFSLDLTARINRHKAELKFASHRNSELQEAWNLYGESAFAFGVLDSLDHRDDPKTDPAEELPVLLEMWIRRLENEGHSVVVL